MFTSVANVCTRCGKLRIDKKSWRERTKGAVIIHTASVCPDPACQKIVDQQISDQRNKRQALERQKSLKNHHPKAAYK